MPRAGWRRRDDARRRPLHPSEPPGPPQRVPSPSARPPDAPRVGRDGRPGPRLDRARDDRLRRLPDRGEQTPTGGLPKTRTLAGQHPQSGEQEVGGFHLAGSAARPESTPFAQQLERGVVKRKSDRCELLDWRRRPAEIDARSDIGAGVRKVRVTNREAGAADAANRSWRIFVVVLGVHRPPASQLGRQPFEAGIPWVALPIAQLKDRRTRELRRLLTEREDDQFAGSRDVREPRPQHTVTIPMSRPHHRDRRELAGRDLALSERFGLVGDRDPPLVQHLPQRERRGLVGFTRRDQQHSPRRGFLHPRSVPQHRPPRLAHG